jgi:hypothetical protein
MTFRCSKSGHPTGGWRHLIKILMMACAWAPHAVAAGDLPATSQQQDMLAASIGYRLRQSNAGWCPKTGPLVGWALHDISAYDRKSRPNVEERYGLGLDPGLRLIVAKSAADRAGFRRGDVLVALGPTLLSGVGTGPLEAKASPARTDRLENWIETQLRAGPQAFTIRRDRQLLYLTLTADIGCDGEVVVAPDNSSLAWSNGRDVAITARLFSYLNGDDELAFIIAHEMGHIWLRQARERRKSPAAADNWLMEIAAMPINEESRADLIGIAALRRGGYAPEAVAGLLTRLASQPGEQGSWRKSSIARREAILQSTIGDKDTKKSRQKTDGPFHF